MLDRSWRQWLRNVCTRTTLASRRKFRTPRSRWAQPTLEVLESRYALSGAATLAATLTVNTLATTAPSVLDTQLSLGDALKLANGDFQLANMTAAVQAQVTGGNPGLNDTIVLMPGTYVFSAADNATNGPNALPVIRDKPPPMRSKSPGAGATWVQSWGTWPLLQWSAIGESG